MQDYISIQGGKIASYMDGAGTPILCLHGGPGDTHHYMRRMIQPLCDQFQFINYDQRGTGGSVLEVKDESTLYVERFFDDILRIKDAYDLGKLTLLGHSWGAILALLFNANYPEHVKALGLISMGPINPDNEKIYAQRLMSVFSEAEKIEWQRLRQNRKTALAQEDMQAVLDLDKRLMALRVKSWVFIPDKRQAFLDEYFQDPPPDREVNKHVWASAQNALKDMQVDHIKTPVWICYGERDCAPIYQAEELDAVLPKVEIDFIPNCGHIPWLDQPDPFLIGCNRFYSA